MLEPNETCLRCKKVTIVSEKMPQQIKIIFWEQWVWRFKSLNLTSYAK